MRPILLSRIRIDERGIAAGWLPGLVLPGGDGFAQGAGLRGVVAAVRDAIAETGQGPSVREIQRVTGLATVRPEGPFRPLR
ncbi:hypothetical protein [Streptomyces sp. NPDC001054]